MLEIQNVSKTFNAGTVNEKTALNGLNLKLNEGDFVTVIGGNGAGKSTMLNAVAGVWPVDSGKIIIDHHTPEIFRIFTENHPIMMPSSPVTWEW